MKKTALIWTAPLWAGALVGGLAACDTTIEVGTAGSSGSSSAESTAVAVSDGGTTISATNDDASLDDQGGSGGSGGSGGDAVVIGDVSTDLSCDGQDVTVSQVQAVVVLLGDCGTVTVTGDQSTVTVDSAEHIVIDASQTTVTATSSGPVDVKGVQNVVTVTFMDGDFTDEGSQNELISVM